MKVIPQGVIYEPTFSYIWMLAEDRFSGRAEKRVARKTALREIALAYLAGARMSVLGETARASGLSRVEAGWGKHQLVGTALTGAYAGNGLLLGSLDLEPNLLRCPHGVRRKTPPWLLRHYLLSKTSSHLED
jgi:hypothetical protein